ncbi:MAG: PAS domain S-box protein [Acidobacteria bacterium]|nr:MAG: PAS domain S-box protein [Acidobacteriota bacterium]
MVRDPRASDDRADTVCASRDEFFRRVVEGMRCGIVTVDVRGHVVTVNELARRILQLDDRAVTGGPVADVLAGQPRLAEVLLAALDMNHLPNRAEMEIRTRDDRGRTIGFTISPIAADGVPLGVALFFKDLTQVERREEQERLRDRLAALGQMAASLAHEIRNPLASIDVTATLLKRRLRDAGDETLRLVDKIIDEVARLNGTVTRGLEFARAIRPELTVQPLAPILDEALAEALARRPDGQAVRVERTYDARTPQVPVDATFIRQVFVNLIVNALEALEGRGTLSLSLAPVEGGTGEPIAVEVRIGDDGPGIPGEIRDKLFYPFVTTKKDGSGIGLAMARKIVECHHGLIDVTSGPGRGTVFRVRLPLPPDPPAEA